MGRLTTLTHSTMTLTMLTVTYGYDAESRVILETADGSATTYVYDAENQLTTAGTETYTYDASGNRNSTGYVVSTGNRVTNDGVWTYTYDVEGQLTKKSKGASQETWSYSYDERGLMTAASKANTDGGSAVLTYTFSNDVFGERIQSITATMTQRRALDYAGGGGEEYLTLDGSNILTVRYVNAPDGTQAARQAASGVNVWVGTDRLGSVRTIQDTNGVQQGEYNYTGFGQPIVISGAAWLGRYAYTSGEYVSDLGLQKHGARWYDPVQGRWTTEDPIGFAAGDYNLHRYVGNNATNAVDPTGLEKVYYRTRPPIDTSSGSGSSAPSKTIPPLLEKAELTLGGPPRKQQPATPKKDTPSLDEKSKKNAIEQFNIAQNSGFKGDNVKLVTENETGSSIILVVPSIYGGKQSVLYRTDKVDNPAYEEFLRQQSFRFRELAGPSPDPLQSFAEYVRYGRLRQSYFDVVITHGPPKKIDVPRELYYSGELASAKSMMAMRETKEERNLAQEVVDNVFPYIPAVKTANMILILDRKVKGGEKASFGEVVGIVMSFGDDVVTLSPAVVWSAGKLGKLARKIDFAASPLFVEADYAKLMFQGVKDGNQELIKRLSAQANDNITWWMRCKLRIMSPKASVQMPFPKLLGDASALRQITRQLADITLVTGKEAGLIQLPSGKLVLRLGRSARAVGVNQGEKLLAHVHPSGLLIPSTRMEMRGASDLALWANRGQDAALLVGPAGDTVYWVSASKQWADFGSNSDVGYKILINITGVK